MRYNAKKQKTELDFAKNLEDLYLNGLYQECLEYSKKILSIEENNEVALMFAGKASTHLGIFEQAQNYLIKAYYISPNHEIAKEIGNLFLRNQDLKIAKKWYLVSIELNSEYSPALCNLGNIEFQSGNTDKALELYESALKHDPQLIIAYIGAAYCLNRLKKHEDTISLLNTALSIDNGSKNINELMGIALQVSGQNDLAATYYEKEIELNPQALLSLANLGTVMLTSKRYTKAIHFLKQAASINPSQEILTQLAQAYQGIHDWENAIHTYEALANNQPPNPYVLTNLGICLMQLDLFRQAISYFEKALEIDPQIVDAHYYKNALLAKEGRDEEALIELMHALLKIPDSYLLERLTGSIYKKNGDIEHALIHTLKAKKLSPNNIDISIQLSNIYQAKGELSKARDAISSTLSDHPDNTEALIALSAINIDLEDYKNALKCINKALLKDPNCAEAFLNRGSIFSIKGEHQRALEEIEKCIHINPNIPIAYLNLGSIYEELGDIDQAIICTLKAITLDCNRNAAISNLNRYCKRVSISEDNLQIVSKSYDILINSNNIFHDKLNNIFSALYLSNFKNAANSQPIISETNSRLYQLINNQQLLKSLTRLIPANPEIEIFLTRLREEILLQYCNGAKVNPDMHQFTCVLAIQCYLNEYAFSQTEKEEELIQRFLDNIKNSLNEYASILPILACYIPLYQINILPDKIKESLATTQYGELLFQIQVNEPRKQKDIFKNIEAVSKIDDDVSREVKIMYEENPFPRYNYADFTPKDIRNPAAFHIKNESTNLSIPFINSLKEANSQPEVLIAGCGTGQQVIHASRYRNAVITAIDLSQNSLAYAARKAGDYDMNNVRFKMMSILDIPSIDKYFDLIECKGVLHHMEDPTRGLQALVSKLKPGGYIKIGLYSEIARELIIKARENISNLGIRPTPDGIRNFRKLVLEHKISGLSKILLWARDFYSLSECRDMCFHVQEHRLSINDLKVLLEGSGLTFCGFIVSNSIRKKYIRENPNDSEMLSLQKWSEFETKYPETFSETYQFWAYKPQ